MLHGQASGFEGVVEAVAGRRCRHDDHRAFAVAAVERLLEVALLGFRRKARRGSSALYVHHDQRQFGHHRQSQRLARERQSRSRGGRHGEVAREGRADGRADAGDLVLGLHGLHPEVLALGQFFEDHRGRGDRVRTAEERKACLFGRGAESPRRGYVAVDRTVGSLLPGSRGHGVVIGELMGVGGVVVARRDGQFVGLGHGGIFLGEFPVEVFESVILRTVEQPEADAQCEHVLAFDDGFVVQSGLFQRLARHGSDVGNDDVVLVETQFGQRVEGCESRLLEMFFGDRIAVEDDRRARLEPLSVGFECRRVHRHQHVAVIAGIQLAVVAEMYLEARNARNGSLRGADFGGVVGEGRDAVSQQRRSVGKERARELHAVARIARKADHDVLQLPHFCLFHDFGFRLWVNNDFANIGQERARRRICSQSVPNRILHYANILNKLSNWTFSGDFLAFRPVSADFPCPGLLMFCNSNDSFSLRSLLKNLFRPRL